MADVANQTELGEIDIAIVGMAAHLPGAGSVSQ
jgi:phosphoribosylcarboxyaminoimidazole (NCAIR) mutase